MAVTLQVSPVVVLFWVWMIHPFCQHNVLALVAQPYAAVAFHYHTHWSSRPTWPHTLASTPKDDDNTDLENDGDDDDGWGDDLPILVETPPQSEKGENRMGPEQDLFIPTFAIVSIAGLLGSYGYEMLRLQANGELYLPWSSH